MKEFRYISPTTIENASGLLKEPDSLAYAGGTDALGMIKHKILDPETVVNLKQLPGLDKVTYKAGKGFVIGALVRIDTVAKHPVIEANIPLLAAAASEVASPQLRNMGTLGGNLCQRPRCWYFRGEFDCLRKGGEMCYAYDGENKYHCITGGDLCFIVHPSDTATALTALDAILTITDGEKSRDVPIRDFFILPEDDITRENILKPGEILTHVTSPEPTANERSAFIKFKERDVWDFAVVSVALKAKVSGGKILSGKIAYGGVAPKPWEEAAVNSALSGLALNETEIGRVAEMAFREASPLAKNGYKITLARNLTRKVLRQIA